MRFAVIVILAFVSTASFAASIQDPRLAKSYRFENGGWTYVHLAGTPEQIGFQHGYLLAREIEDNIGVYRLESVNLYKKDWSFFREAGRTVLWPHVEPEYKAELQGIADGLKAQGSTIDLGTWLR